MEAIRLDPLTRFTPPAEAILLLLLITFHYRFPLCCHIRLALVYGKRMFSLDKAWTEAG
jgi:hypothetical protein